MPSLHNGREENVPSGYEVMDGILPSEIFDGEMITPESNNYIGLQGINLNESIETYTNEVEITCTNEVQLTPTNYVKSKRVKFDRVNSDGIRSGDVIQRDEVLREESATNSVIWLCGNCNFEKCEDNYRQEYFVGVYGDLKCCNEKCENIGNTMSEFIKKGDGKCVWICKNCVKDEDEKHGCQQMYCNKCYFKVIDKSGNSKRTRRCVNV